MFKQLITLTITTTITLFAGNALATFGNLELIRVYYDRAGSEIMTDLGNVTAVLTDPSTTIAGSFDSLTTGFISYYALDKNTNQLWASGSTTSTSVVTGSATGMTGMKNATTGMYTTLNSQGGTNFTGLASAPNSFLKKLSATQGNLAGAINNNTRTNTEVSLINLLNGSSNSITQLLYFWANGNATVAADKIGVPVAAITTKADGSTYILPIATINLDTIAPTVTTFAIPPEISTDRKFVNNISFTATDTIDTSTSPVAPNIIEGVVAGYMITESATPPLSTDAGWSTTPLTSYSIPPDSLPPYGVLTTKTLYAWVKDLKGNVSTSSKTATVDINAIDLTKPYVTAFSIPTSSSSATITGITFTAFDDSGTVNGYLITESNTLPPTTPGWSSTPPTSYTISTPPALGTPTDVILYAWVRDAAGNVSELPYSAPVNVTISAGDATPPITTITTPAPLTTASATASIDISATDDTGVTAYLINESATPPAVDNAGWVAITPTTNTGSMPVSYLFSGIVPDTLTPKTLYVWAKDAAGNVSVEKSILLNVTIPVLTVTIVNSASDINNNPGGGEISSDKGGIACPTGNVCSSAFDSVLLPGPVTLSAVPNTDSLFTGWSSNIACNGSNGTCALTMNVSQGVTATFDRLKLVRTTDGVTPKGYFGRVQNALKASVHGDIIQLTQSPFNENLTFDQVIGSDVVTLAGGYDPAFAAIPAGFTTIQGTLFVKNGKLIADGIAIRP